MKKVILKLKLVLLLAALVAMSGCASSMMTNADTLLEPDSGYAVVNFLRPSSFGGAIKFGIWDSEDLVGILTPKAYIQHKASPGEHIFLARAENWSAIKATLEAGRNYYILVSPKMGLLKARVNMSVIAPDDPKLDKWLKSLKPITVIPEKRDAYVAERLESVKAAATKVESGSTSATVMNPTDGR